MKQTVATRHEFHECTVRHHAANHTVIHLTNFGHSHDRLDFTQSCVYHVLICATHLYDTYAVCLLDGNDSTGFLLNTLDNLSARADDSTDELFRYRNLNDTRNVRLQLGTRSRHTFGQLAQDVFTSGFRLHQCLLQNLITQTVALDIHLSGSQTIDCTGRLEIHIAQVVFVT